MNQSEDRDVEHCGVLDTRHSRQSRLRSVVFEGGKLHIRDCEGLIPSFLVDASAALCAGQVERARGLLDERAVESVRVMVDGDPSRTDVMFVLAIMLRQTGRMGEAEQWCQRILKHEHNAVVYNELGYICQSTARLSQAVEYHAKAVEMDRDNAELCANLARALVATGQTREGIDLFRKAVEADPTNAALHSNFLFYLHYLPDLDPRMLSDEHKRWGRMHAPARLARVSHTNDPDPDRRLRIGYISPYFCMTSQVYNFEPLLDGHDREAVEVYAYGNVQAPSSVTERLAEKFDHYRSIYSVGDQAVVEMILRDKIDILVELAGHVSDNRLGVLVYKPAPIAVDYLGNNTSGISAIDYRLTDALVNQEGTEQFYTEELVFLESHLGYMPQDSAPPVVSLPALRNGYVTFGSFNNSCKVNLGVIELWTRVLRANGDSRFLLKFGGGVDRAMMDYYFEQFERFGIGRDRIAIYGWSRVPDYLQLYGEVDIALDAYPYNGCITTLEGMWMGVPIVSLVGQCLVSRFGLNILSNLGMEFFAARTGDEYVVKASALAQNLEALAKIRAAMRERMTASVLCDGRALARRIEEAYRKMWRRWCRSQNGNAASPSGRFAANCNTPRRQ